MSRWVNGWMGMKRGSREKEVGSREKGVGSREKGNCEY